MALQPCRECGQQVSTEAKTCPNCGVKEPTRPAQQKPKHLGVIIVIGILIAIAAALNGGEDSDAAEWEGTNITAQSPRGAIGKCGYNPSDGQLLGEIVDVNGAQVSVRHPRLGRLSATYPTNVEVRTCP